MIVWEQFFPDLLPYVPGCAEPAAEHALRRSAQRFFSRTRVWTLWLDALSCNAGVIEYDLNLESKSELVRLERATLAGRDIAVVAPEALPANWQDFPSQCGACIHSSNRQSVIVLPPPGEGALLNIEASLKPANTAVGVEQRFFDSYAEVIAKGARAYLMRQPGMPYSNPAEAQLLEQEFGDAMATIAMQRNRGFSSYRPRQRGHYF